MGFPIGLMVQDTSRPRCAAQRWAECFATRWPDGQRHPPQGSVYTVTHPLPEAVAVVMEPVLGLAGRARSRGYGQVTASSCGGLHPEEDGLCA